MSADKASYYLNQLYPLQDEVLRVITACNTDFYLTGGTALSRHYLHHRYSDDLDFFVNHAHPHIEDPRFPAYVDTVLAALNAVEGWQLHVAMRQQYFVRATISRKATALKLEFINDVPSHIGAIAMHQTFGRLDSIENIFANKITAARDRDEPRDLADIWAIVKTFGLSIEDAITNAGSKAAGTYHVELARKFINISEADWGSVNWINPPDLKDFLSSMKELGERLLLPK